MSRSPRRSAGSRPSAETDWLAGFHAVEAAVRNDPDHVLAVVFEQGRQDRRATELRELAESAGLAVREEPKAFFQRQARDLRHQGVLAQYARAEVGGEADLFALLDRLDEAPFLLVLDGVTDPHNLGACLRTAEAAGVHAVIAPKDRAAGITPTARKVASGSAERLPFFQVTNLARLIDDLKQRHIWVLGAAGEGSVSLYQSSLGKEPVAVVMGSEGKGLRRLTREHCDQLIHIPMRAPVESLNISVAAAVCLYELRRQRDA